MTMRAKADVTSPKKLVSWMASDHTPVSALVTSSVSCWAAPVFLIFGRSELPRLCTSSMRMRKPSVAPA